MRRMVFCAVALLLVTAGCGKKAPPQGGEQSVSKTRPTAPANEDKSRHDPWQEYARRREELKGPEGLTLTLATDKQEYYAGEPILVTTTYKMKGPGKVQVSTRTYDRSGRISDLEWTVVGPDGKPAPDPLVGYPTWGPGGGIGGRAKVFEGTPFSQGFYVNEWARLNREGNYEIAVVSRRLSGVGSVVSDRVKIKVRKSTEAEINAAITRYTKAMNEKKPDRDRKGGFDYHKAALFLRFLHDERALPHYVKFLNIQEFSFQALCGIYGLPDHKKAFAALSAKVADKDYPISWSVARTYEWLYLSLNPLPEGVNANDWGRVGPAKKRHDKIQARLRVNAATKSPRARAISVLILTPSSNQELEHAIELATCLKDLPENLLSNAMHRLGLKKVPEIVPYLESYLEHKNGSVRSAAIKGLIKQGLDKYLDIYLDDYVSVRPRYHGYPKELSEARQLKLAALLVHHDRAVAGRAARSLEKFATTKKIVPFIRKGLEKWRYTHSPIPQMFEAWVKVDPDGAKRPLINYLQSDPTKNLPHDIVGLLKHYLDDPQVVQLIVDVTRSNRIRSRWRAREVLTEARLPEAVPVLLEEARATTSALSWGSWRNGLEKVTGHIIPLTSDHNSLAKQAAVVDEWERWWSQYKDRPLSERMRSNIEHALGLLENGDLSGRAHRLLIEVTGKKFSEDLYVDPVVGSTIKKKTVNKKKLNALWAKWWAANRDTFRPVERE